MKMGFSEDMRLGIKEKRQLNGPVKEYRLSIEEHAKYMDRDAIALNRARELAREGLKTPKEVTEETGADYEKVKQIFHYEYQRRHARYAKKRRGWQ